jgi:hypothetical protein
VFDGSVRTISWRDVLTAFTDLAHEDRGLTSGAERILVADFLTFVDTNFSQLGPFSTLQRCEAEPYRLHRRLNGVLSQVLASDSNSLPGSHTAVITAYLDYEDRQVKLHMYPADTLQHKRDWSVLSGGYRDVAETQFSTAKEIGKSSSPRGSTPHQEERATPR